MHPYSTDSNERVNVVLVLGVLAVVLALVFSRLTLKFNWDIPWYVETPSPLFIFGLLFYFFDRHVWKWWVVKFIGLVKVPNIEGSWHCVLKSSYDDFQQEYESTVMIRQRWSTLQVNFRNSISSSSSNAGAILISRPEGVIVTYQYMNEPSPHAVDTMNIHYGTARLELAEDERKMEGSYYTGRGRQNHGTIVLNKT